MNRKLLGGFAAVTTVIVALSAAACGTPPPETENPNKPNDKIEIVDKSDLPFVNSLDSYKKSDWHGAKWIWTEKSPANAYVAFRKTVNLTADPIKATLDISAESKYFLWVNDTLAVYDGCPKRGATYYDAYYEQVDLTPYLKRGENILVFMVAYNGRSGTSSVDPGNGGLLFELDADGQKFVSDSSVKLQRLSAYRNQALLRDDWPNYPQAGQLAEWNVYYDASHATGEFYKSSFDDSAWDTATEVARPGEAPFNELYRTVTPLISFDDSYTYLESPYIGQKLVAPATITIDMPERQNLQFSPYFELNADSDGSRITYYTNTYTTQSISSFKDDYIAVKGEQKYESYPWRSGSQLIIEAPAGVTFNKIGIRKSNYATTQAGSFKCGNDKLDKLWQKAYNTLLICMRDSYMDCPERERSPYLGDSANQISETFYAMDDNAHALTKKTILNTIGWTKTDKAIPLRSPGSNLAENPGQTLAFITETYNYYMHTGDAETMRLFYPVAVDYLKLWKLKADGTLETRNGSFLWTDWGDGYDAEVMQNCWYYYALNSMKKLADNLEITSDTAYFTDTAAKLKAGFARFAKTDGYASGTAYDDRANALAVLSGLADKEMYGKIVTILTDVKGASPFMEKYVLEALAVMGEYDACIERMLDRYGNMIDDVDGTLWEVWDKTPSAGTMNHGWSGGALTVLSKYFGGISPVKAGFEKYEIVIGGYFDNLETKVSTAKGDISYKLTKTANGYTVTLETVNSECTLKISDIMGSSISVSGGTYVEADAQDGYKCITLTGGGAYSITVS